MACRRDAASDSHENQKRAAVRPAPVPDKTMVPGEGIEPSRRSQLQGILSPFGTGRFCENIVNSTCLSPLISMELPELTQFDGNSPIFSTHMCRSFVSPVGSSL